MSHLRRLLDAAGRVRTGRFLALPGVIASGLLIAVPLAMLARQSTLMGSAGYSFVFGDPDFRRAFVRTLYYVLFTVPAQMLLGLVLALALARLTPVRGAILGVLLFLPYVVPSVAAVLAWQLMLREDGWLAKFASAVTALPRSSWLGDHVLVSVAVVSLWQFYPFVLIALLAALRRIPVELVRSARLDGAGSWQVLRWITLPLLLPALTIVGTLRLAFMFTKFDTPWLLAGTTSVSDVQTLPIYIYLHSQTPSHEGRAYAAAAGALLAATIVGVLALFAVARSLTARFRISEAQ